MNVLRIDRSAQVTARCLRIMGPVVEAALEVWPRTTDGCVWVTSGFRDGDPLFHGEHKALDFRVWNITGWDLLDEVGRQNLVTRLGGLLIARISVDYDVEPHPELVMRQPHVHVEHDPKGG